MPTLFTVDEVLAATQGQAEGLTGTPFGAVSIDSRELGPDALFVAIKGDRFDGHDFVDQALNNGAAAALVSRGSGDRRIVVDDALEGLRDLARAARARSRAIIVGVTGSVGKTTTKEAIRTVFEDAAETHASIKSFNNHWGVPLMLARLPESAQFGVFEMGMSGPYEIRPLSQLVRPHIAVITTVAAAHLEAFGSLDGIARAKAEIFAGIEPGGTAVLNADHPQLNVLLEQARADGIGNIVTYGEARGTDWQILEIETAADKSFATIVHNDERHALVLNVPGRHMVANATAALAVAYQAGVEIDVALRALAGFGLQAGRGQRRLLGPAEKPVLLIDESYNANTASMRAALDVFAAQQAPGGRKVVVLGDMLELGAQSAALHAGLRDAVLASGAERIYLVGQEVAALADALGRSRVTAHTHSAAEMAPILRNDLAYGDAVMVKGSNGVGLSDIVDKIGQQFESH
ncbi:UDP-N-acetylmuramoyl-tripeptide--D-alanyl-D-alanine ligase [Devosia sp. BSSL-BM10]|uniref:UDP-N-acetylmuramoyl-tripeptide--D-alanyl-D-alanine ligase n=1 Tax=Devosia litorisediminis TaxID=2829817 RepID=A0A942E939_9HYPH|nr:UDP-N-acetylmuramoyl-tripeptide--D-alanyl-D-alanine ligase [Devosia litorisediminis]MBS3847797.1 UDP-N-acetylmuramoyl-tripeptide--D-alanyl-D-alanine ligase [Devosia litorisediminis]